MPESIKPVPIPEHYATLADAMKALRKKAKLTTAQAAAAAGITEDQWIALENGACPRTHMLWRIAGALGVGVQDMMA